MKSSKIKLLIMAVFCLVFQMSNAQTFEPNQAVDEEIANKSGDLDDLKNTICNEVDNLTGDVSDNSGVLSYPNWVRFVQIARAIDSLNDIWNEAYGDALESIIQLAISENCTDVDSEDEPGKDLLAIIIEEEYLVFEDDIASVCFEEKFDFYSLRKKIKEQEDDWLNEPPSEEFNPGDSPRFTEVLYDEEFWTLIREDREYIIEDTDLDENMLENADVPPGDFADLIETIQEIVDILGDIVNIAGDLMNLFADCAGSTTASEEDYRYGVPVPNESAYVGYYIIQRGQLIDFASKTVTKIKGKARLYKLKNNGKGKRDRRNRASIGFCAWEWNNCDDEDWLLSGPYVKPHIDGVRGGRTKVKHREPKALAISETYHFLQFKFGKNGIYAGDKKLLGNTGCSHQSSTVW